MLEPGDGPTATGCGRQVLGRRHPEQQRDEHQAQAVVGLLQLGHQRPALGAALEVGVDLAPVAQRQTVAHVGAELGACLLAGERHRLLQVSLEVRLAQALPGAVGECGGGVGRQADQRGDLCRARRPSTSVCHSTICQRSGNEAKAAAIIARSSSEVALVSAAEVDLLRNLGGDVEALVLAGAVVEDVADGRQQVGTEGDLWAAAVADGDQQAGERFGDQIVGVVLGAGEAARRRLGRATVTAIELGVGLVVTGARRD